MPISDADAFIRSNTTVLPVPLVPEIYLHIAHESVPLWQRTEEELGTIGLPPPFWAFAWAGGQALARYVLDNRETVKGKTVVDLASGSGLVAIAAKLAGAASVLAADIDMFAMRAISLNAYRNAASIETSGEDLLRAAPPSVDTILVGDMFYERHLAETVLDWLLAAKANGTCVLIGDPGRSYLPTAKLIKLSEYNVPVTRDLEDADIKRTAIWRLA